MPHMSGFGGSVRWAAGSANKPEWGDNVGVHANDCIQAWDLSSTTRIHDVPYQGSALRSAPTPTRITGLGRWVAHVRFLCQSDMDEGASNLNTAVGLGVTVYLVTVWPRGWTGTGIITTYDYDCPLDGPIEVAATIISNGDLAYSADVEA